MVHSFTNKGAQLSETVVVSPRGLITLPVSVRKRLGIKAGDVVILEERGNGLDLKPGAVFEIDLYSGEDMAQWDSEDALSGDRRNAIIASLKGPNK